MCAKKCVLKVPFTLTIGASSCTTAAAVHNVAAASASHSRRRGASMADARPTDLRYGEKSCGAMAPNWVNLSYAADELYVLELKCCCWLRSSR